MKITHTFLLLVLCLTQLCFTLINGEIVVERTDEQDNDLNVPEDDFPSEHQFQEMLSNFGCSGGPRRPALS